MKSITLFLNEGIIRGLANEPWTLGQAIKSIIDGLHLIKGMSPEQKQKRIKQALFTFKREIKNMNVKFNIGSFRPIQKFMSAFGLWRHHVILNDKVYNDHINKILETGKGPNIVGNISWSVRIIPDIFQAKDSNDLVNVLEKYEKRIDELVNFTKKHPDNPGFDPMLTWGIYGLRDLMIVVNRMATYSAKGI